MLPQVKWLDTADVLKRSADPGIPGRDGLDRGGHNRNAARLERVLLTPPSVEATDNAVRSGRGGRLQEHRGIGTNRQGLCDGAGRRASTAMTPLEDIGSGARVRGIAPGQAVQVVSVEWIGDQAINVIYRGPTGSLTQ